MPCSISLSLSRADSDVLYRAWRLCFLRAIKPKLDDWHKEDSAGITPLRHVPIWDGSKRTLYDLAAYIAQMVEALKTKGPLPDLASFKMEKLAPLSL